MVVAKAFHAVFSMTLPLKSSQLHSKAAQQTQMSKAARVAQGAN
jgi:hypothetical protein